MIYYDVFPLVDHMILLVDNSASCWMLLMAFWLIMTLRRNFFETKHNQGPTPRERSTWGLTKNSKGGEINKYLRPHLSFDGLAHMWQNRLAGNHIQCLTLSWKRCWLDGDQRWPVMVLVLLVVIMNYNILQLFYPNFNDRHLTKWFKFWLLSIFNISNI